MFPFEWRKSLQQPLSFLSNLVAGARILVLPEFWCPACLGKFRVRLRARSMVQVPLKCTFQSVITFRAYILELEFSQRSWLLYMCVHFYFF